MTPRVLVRFAPFLLCACATFGTPGQRVSSLEVDAVTCDDFLAFEARATTLLEELTRAAVDVIDSTARVTAARRACAAAVLSHLLVLREAQGPEAAQQQLDAIAEALSEPTFSVLINNVTADPNLRAMAALASATAATSRSNRANAGREHDLLSGWRVDAPREASKSEPLDDATASAHVHHCIGLTPDQALECLSELAAQLPGPREREAVTSAVRAAAARKIESLQVLPPAQRAAPLARWASTLAKREIDAPELAQALEAARQAVWPEVMTAQREGRVEQAAVLAEPFVILPVVRAEVERLREAAAAKQLRSAAQAGSKAWASAFHRHLAARFGAPAASWPETATQWDTSRFRCAHPPGPLPSAAGLSLRLVATCKRTQRASDAVRTTDEKMKTFEAERSFEWEDIEGTLFISCANQVMSYRVASRDLAIDTGQNESAFPDEPGAPQSALSLALQKVIAGALPECQAARARRVKSDCASLSSSEAFDIEDRFTEAAVAERAWPACFVQWLDTQLGIAPPALWRAN
jgi:hypothetical protein